MDARKRTTEEDVRLVLEAFMRDNDTVGRWGSAMFESAIPGAPARTIVVTRPPSSASGQAPSDAA